LKPLAEPRPQNARDVAIGHGGAGALHHLRQPLARNASRALRVRAGDRERRGRLSAAHAEYAKHGDRFRLVGISALSPGDRERNRRGGRFRTNA